MIIPTGSVSGALDRAVPDLVSGRKDRLRTTFTEYGLEHGFDADSQFDEFWAASGPQEGETSFQTAGRLQGIETEAASFLDNARTSATVDFQQQQDAGQAGDAGAVFQTGQEFAQMQGAASTLLTGTSGPDDELLTRRRRLQAGKGMATQDLLG